MTEKQIAELIRLPRTDKGNGERLRRLFGRTWQYLPRYKTWMHWDGHCWEGRKTRDLLWAAAEAFQELALEIYRLPVPADDMSEQRLRLRVIHWLPKSQTDCRRRMAVKYFKAMPGEEN